MVRKNYRMTTIDLAPDQYKMLKVMAAQQGSPMAEIIRYAVDDYLSANMPDYIKTQNSMRKFKEYADEKLKVVEVKQNE